MIGKEREGNMTEREIILRLPTSGQIIGALVAGLGIKHERLQSRTARRYFSGDPEQLVKDSNREEIIGVLADVLTGSGFISSLQVAEGNDRPAPTLASMLQWHADNWDLSRSFLRRRTASVLPSNLPKILDAYVRLAVIDLALRVAAHLHLAGSSPAALDLLGCANRAARGDYLNQKRQQAAISLEDLAQRVGVGNNTVDAWMYHGARPSDDNLEKTAQVLADNIEGSNPSGIALELRALYWISDVAGLLEEHIGAEAGDVAIGRLRLYAGETYHIIEGQFPAEERAANLTILADLGVGARLAEPLLAALIEQETDDEWREDLRSTGFAWVRRVLSVNLQVHLDEVDDPIDMTDGRLLEDWDVGNPEAYAHYRRSQELQVQGKLHEALVEVEKAARLDPLDPANRFTLGSVKTGIGMWNDDTALVNEGLNALRLAVKLDPKWIVPWTEIGMTLLHTGRPEEAVAHLRNMKPECGPLDSHYYSALGTAYWKLHRLSEALEAFEAALELDPEETSTWVAASELALLTGDADKRRRYSRIARHFGADEGTDRIMELLRKIGEIEQANGAADEHDWNIALMTSVIKLNPDAADALRSRSRSHFEKGEYDLAISDLDAFIRLNPDDAGAHVARGILYGERSRWDCVIADMTEAIRLTPDDAMAHYQRGVAFGEQHTLEQAIVDLTEAIRLDPNFSEAYCVRGNCHRYQEKYDLAIADLTTSLKLDPDNAPAHIGRAMVYWLEGQLDQAIADYSAALLIQPGDPLAHRLRGQAYVAVGNYDQAVADYNIALKLSPGDAYSHVGRSKAYLFSGKLELALADFDAAVQADPNSGVVIHSRGWLREKMGDAEGAERDYQRARELGYDNRQGGGEN